MREQCDQALKLVGMLPNAVKCAETDPVFIETVIAKLSDQLCCLDANLGDERPTPQDQEKREAADGRGTTTPPNGSFPEAYVIQRDNAIASWLTELTELMSEHLANTDCHDDSFQELKHIHNRLWAMRWNFGFLIEEVRDGEAGK
jgi:hypothetical protein